MYYDSDFNSSCLHRELANQHSENLRTVLKYVIYNELSNSRNPNNMALLGTIFQSNQEKAAKVCKKVFVHEVLILLITCNLCNEITVS